jgi:tRNA G18 (ribose-2'-O)-methylase SpoU
MKDKGKEIFMNDNRIVSVNSIDIPELSVFQETSEVQLYRMNEPDLGIFIAESSKVTLRALDAGYEPLTLLLEKRMYDREAKELTERVLENPEAKVYVADEDILTKITGYNLTGGVLCAMRRKELPAVAEVLKDARRVAVLENVNNPTNVGAIVRSATALGMDAVLFTKGCSDPLYRRAIRVSMGNIFLVPWTFLPEGQEFESLKECGFKSVAMALRSDTVNIDDKDLKETEKLAIFLGSEGEGLLPETIKSCDYCVKIPMYHGADSLNVAAAAAVAFWELSKK